MSRSDRTVPRQRRFGALAEGAALLVLTAAITVPAVMTGASTFDGHSGPTPDAPDRETGRIVVCDSGTVHQGDVTTSSSVAWRVSDSTTATIPTGCREG
jgi:hypothetical protein